MKRVFFVVLTLLMVAGVVFATGGREGDRISMRFSWWGVDARHEATLAVISAFERLNPNITIEPEYGAQTGYNEQKTVQFASGTAPDIFQIETGAGPEYQRLGVLYNLSRISTLSFNQFDQNFLVTNGQFGTGSQWALPTGMAGSALVVNQTLANRIGIDLTQQYDWEQLIVWGRQVQAWNPQYYLLSANAEHAMPFFVRAKARQLNGAAIINDETLTLTATEAQFTQIFDFIDRMYRSGTAAPAAYKAPFGNQDQNDPNWINGMYVAHVGYSSSAEVVQAANPSVQYVAGAMPLLANRRSDGWFNDTPQYMGISATTRYPEQAGSFLNFFFNTEEAARLLGTVRSVPPTAMAQRIVTEAGQLNALTAESVARSITYNGATDGGLTTSAEVTSILLNAYEAVSYGSMAPAAAARTVVDQINAFLARQR